MNPIVSRSFICATVEAAREKHGNTQAALDAAARVLCMDAETVATVAAEEAQARAVVEVAADIAAVSAHSMGITLEVVDAPHCKDTGRPCRAAATVPGVCCEGMEA